MPLKPSPDPMSSMWAWLAHDLRLYRVMHKMSGTRFGQIINVTRSTVSRLESGELKIDEQQAIALDTALNTGGHFLRLLTYAKQGHDPNWFKEHVSYETRARVMKIFELALMPGLLQTPGYARACFEAAGVEDPERQTEERVSRQSALDRSPRPLLWVLLAQNAVDCPVGGAEVMRAQLAHLLSLNERANISVRVVPRTAGAYVGLDGAFKVMTVEEGDIAYTEAHGGGRLVLSAQEVRSFSVRYDRIGVKALHEEASRDLIREIMEDME
jgi:transcriptional regulator with XRE-family HTH domain